jgi:hypothetical protein
METYKKKLQQFTRQFEKATGKTAYSAKEAARWVIDNGLWKPPNTIALQKCAEDLSTAWREDYVTDPQGRRVRRRHAFVISDNGEQLHLWGDWERLQPNQMALAFQGRRKQIVGECRQLKNDVDSYNENHNKKADIPMSYNFTLDLEETEPKQIKKISANERVPLAAQSPFAARRSASERVLPRP